MNRVRESLHQAGAVLDDIIRVVKQIENEPVESERKLRRLTDDLQRLLRETDDEAKKLER